ncbi:MAG: phosphoglucosamine mutase [Deltaproteobacteria bacterium]|nr:phosphoglucosamine mutase [Deltaproteobacteria bacterium]
MSERKLFGTDGVRGVANVHPMTPELAMALGRAVATAFPAGDGRTRIVIGKDTRLSGYMFETALAAGVCSMGADVLLVGPLPTPGIAYMTVGMRADAGAVISASHNPFEDNGIKFFGGDGFKLPDEVEERVEALVLDPDKLPPAAAGRDFGRAYRLKDAAGRYLVSLKSTFPREFSLDGLRIAVDCANGAGYRVAPMVFEELGADVVPLSADPDGTNINENCGALHPEIMARKVKEMRCDVGLALDGDADRCILCDERGEIVDGDCILTLCAGWMKAQGCLKGDAVVGTIMSNLGLQVALERLGLSLIRTDVGDRYVVEEMLRGDYNLGGEQSGHILFLDHATTGDGILSCLRVLEVMKDTGKSLSTLSSAFDRYPQVLLGAKVIDKPPVESLENTQVAIRRIEKALGDKGRVNVRYSGTSAKIRVMVEGEDEGRVRTLAEEILEAVAKDEILQS